MQKKFTQVRGFLTNPGAKKMKNVFFGHIEVLGGRQNFDSLNFEKPNKKRVRVFARKKKLKKGQKKEYWGYGVREKTIWDSAPKIMNIGNYSPGCFRIKNFKTPPKILDILDIFSGKNHRPRANFLS